MAKHVNMTIKHWPSSERPREKMLAQGAENLSDAELLAIFLRTGTKGYSAIELAINLLNHFNGLRALMNADMDQLNKISGLGIAKTTQLKAILEISKRYLGEKLNTHQLLNNSIMTKQFLIAKLRDKSQEIFSAIFLNKQYCMLKYEELFIGTIDEASIYPREVIKKSLAINASAVIFAHNHPSGSTKPSTADIEITNHLKAALSLVSIKLLDHFIIGGNDSFSFAEQGLISN